MNIPSLHQLAVLPVILPDELIVEVLSFLEVKYLMRMKCVCRSWKTLFSDHVFHKMHLKKQSTRMTHLAIFTEKSDGSGDCRAVPTSRLLETTSNSITLPDDDPYYRFNFKDGGGVVGSCNGLVCLQSCSFAAEYTDYSFCFWNPATRTKSETLVSLSYYHKDYNIGKFAFGYDNSTDTYKVVLLCWKRDGDVITSVVRVFTLGDNVWRDIDCFPGVSLHHSLSFFAEDGVYLNNSTNWFARQRYYCHLKNLTIEQFVIISLDLGTETYRQSMLPRCCDEDLYSQISWQTLSLSVLMDCLCFSYDFKGTHFVMWQMREFGVEESWVQFHKISYSNLQMDYKLRGLESHFTPELIVCPLCVSENGDTVIFAINRRDQVIVYNWRYNRVKRIKSNKKIRWSNARGYVESLVSTS